ncbi:hypothetical protein [Bordetella sp. BOR01]|uniref:hypothetical protein n=1 Tax=Bordetella sp. BOR01 TaxID=2854779 RepID=UPI001C4611F6|nr:hypothetical protein [Bordetella sp. BOR01]MBV7486200.1 hypothetical protein [Bordetella sp. BOR01]
MGSGPWKTPFFDYSPHEIHAVPVNADPDARDISRVGKARLDAGMQRRPWQWATPEKQFDRYETNAAIPEDRNLVACSYAESALGMDPSSLPDTANWRTAAPFKPQFADLSFLDPAALFCTSDNGAG